MEKSTKQDCTKSARFIKYFEAKFYVLTNIFDDFGFFRRTEKKKFNLGIVCVCSCAFLMNPYKRSTKIKFKRNKEKDFISMIF